MGEKREEKMLWVSFEDFKEGERAKAALDLLAMIAESDVLCAHDAIIFALAKIRPKKNEI